MLSQIINEQNYLERSSNSSETKILPIAAEYAARYSAPEMVTGETSGSFYSDVWSYGTLIYEVLTYGQKPFRFQRNVSEKLTCDFSHVFVIHVF